MRRVNPASRAHDQAVREHAARLRRGGYDVAASVPGYTQPPAIGKDARIPDIYAVRGQHVKIVEVKTESDAHTEHSRSQIATFRRSAAHTDGGSFELLIVPDP